ncbi:DUF1553 domain-containing protein [Rhodopirellula halodulae]|uniref:DUF1553 domain-containing protein n=1 Tax=Rhodopirellula halodulae TaxID=2894198 RepID=UPI001E3A2B67|nr:DUF1553 domain-containing protein [Rhodopirellula sp. JC737]MCC9658605.1 DUF1553 domain-containing protein [Rhodopirellula sp. JC737]
MRIPTLIASFAALPFCGVFAADESTISFNRDVRPILSDRCFHCHGPDAENQDSAFRLDSREHATEDLGGYFGIVPGDLESSELHLRIHADDDSKMPPLDAVRHLNDQEIEILDRWIEEGAPFDKHWAFEPIPEIVSVPDPAQHGDWAKNDIDRFVAAQMEQAGLSPNDESTREKWLRRVTFDLTGLPPTLAELDAFLKDTSRHAYETVVDRLLTSDACAERLASEWLDVARYSDTYGYQRDDERFVWPYRDWVIDAFARNLPYDDFITWQLAGDLLPDPTTEQVLATTFNRLHSHKKEGGVAIEEFRVENVADRTHTVGTAFMGLTMECSRCHDHKYDPITQRDYYSLSSFFANVDERGLISYFTDAVPTPAMPLPSEEQHAELNAADDALRSAEQKLQRIQENSEDRWKAWLAGDERKRLAEELKAAYGTSEAEPHPSTIEATARTRVAMVKPLARLSFETIDAATKEEAVDERDREVAAESMRAVVGEHGFRAITHQSNQPTPGRFGQALKMTGDDAVVFPGMGRFRRDQPFSVSMWFNTPELTERAVLFRRSRGWDDAGSVGYELTKKADRLTARLVHFWPGNAIAVETTQPLKANRWTHVTVTYDGSSRASGLKVYLDGELASTQVTADHLTRNITQWREGYQDFALGSRYRDRGFKDGMIDEVQLFDETLSALETRQLFDGKSLEQILAKETALLSDQEVTDLQEFYFKRVHQPTKQQHAKVTLARQRWNDAMDATPAITVMREQSEPRPAYILSRGVYDQPADPVTADTPEFLPEFPENAPRNRLGLAQWLTSPDHPLVSRVTVNRYWQMVFGDGLVRTPEDFGNQGSLPTHPELLDWLSRDFIDSGWDVRRLLRQMVLSSTYRQSPIVPPEKRDRDPDNLYLARSGGNRLTAEMIRDNALAVSGLLVPTVGGPPTKPYDLEMAYYPLDADEGKGQYRRSLYTFWKRTAPAPIMVTMNSGKREVCRVRRELTQSPLQSLALLNGPQFIEASRVLGQRLIKKHASDTSEMVTNAFRMLTSRHPDADEIEILRDLYEEQLELFRESPDEAKELLAVGQTKHDAEIADDELAAATILVSSILNLNESLHHQ